MLRVIPAQFRPRRNLSNRCCTALRCCTVSHLLLHGLPTVQLTARLIPKPHCQPKFLATQRGQ